MALQHLRFGVSTAGAVLALALVAHVIIWCCVHFTDARFKELHPAQDSSSLQVVLHTPEPSSTAKSLLPEGKQGHKADPSRAPAPNSTDELAKPGAPPSGINVVSSKEDVLLRRSAAIVQTTGIIAAIVMALLMFQGVIIAGGGGIPGVEYAVTASSWGLIIALVAIPIASILPAVPYHGVFTSYDILAADSIAFRSGRSDAPSGLVFFTMNLAMPMLVVVGVAAAVFRFRLGVEQGMIVTNVSQLDERIEQEIRNRKMGELSKPRAVAALNQAIGAAPMAAPAPPRIGASPVPFHSNAEPEEEQGGHVGVPLRRPI